MAECLKEMEKVFMQVVARKEKMSKFLGPALSKVGGGGSASSGSPGDAPPPGSPCSHPPGDPKPGPSPPPTCETTIEGRLDIYPCKACNKARMKIIVSKKGQPFLGCSGFPSCKNFLFFPRGLSKISVLEETCGVCSAAASPEIASYMVKLTFVPDIKPEAELLCKKMALCMNGCDEEDYKKLMNIRYNGGGAGAGKKRNAAAALENGGKENSARGNSGGNKKGSGNAGKRKKKGTTKSRATKCPVCGTVGAHPKGFNCPGKKQRKGTKKSKEEATVPRQELSAVADN